ncbi:unnamed protein product [Brugia timori]|uniref:Uncharacterized protein n=1 Tax=Brugia timori TaxID=42155 RepID=A0A0R3R266_9BILA|nr:unnamed protein product [Brugia timori]
MLLSCFTNKKEELKVINRFKINRFCSTAKISAKMKLAD